MMSLLLESILKASSFFVFTTSDTSLHTPARIFTDILSFYDMKPPARKCTKCLKHLYYKVSRHFVRLYHIFGADFFQGDDMFSYALTSEPSRRVKHISPRHLRPAGKLCLLHR